MRTLRTLVLLVAFVPPVQAGEVIVAAASSIGHPVEELIAVFEQETGHTVRLSLGSSGNFYGQIVNGAPFDVFLSADRDYVDRLSADGLIEPGTLKTYAVGRLVVWVPGHSSLQPQTGRMSTLIDPAVRRVAIANPRLAPYGRAAVEAMEYFGISGDVMGRIVRGDNVGQAAQFVSSGGADIGILALSQARTDEMRQGRYWEIPAEAHAPIEQGMAVLTRARQAGHLEAALAFQTLVRGPAGRSILEKYGFTVP